jgi:hypothetical protein
MRALLFSVKQLVQLVAELQVLHRLGQVPQTATPASNNPMLQAQLLFKLLVALSEQVRHALELEQFPHW